MSKQDIREYRIWKGMKSRCSASCLSNLSYQKKGVAVCKRWADNFDLFIEDMGYAPSDSHSLDRIDNDGDYCKENCRWATQGEQSKNRGSFNKVFTHNGESLVLKDWSKKLNIKYTTLYQRIFRSGLTFERAISKDPFSRMIKIDGESKTCREWCDHLSLDYQKVIDRVRRKKTTHKHEILRLIKETL